MNVIDKFLNKKWRYSRQIRILKYQCLIRNIISLSKKKLDSWDEDQTVKKARLKLRHALRGPFRNLKSLIKCQIVQPSRCDRWLELPWNIWELILSCLGIEVFRMAEVCKYFHTRMQRQSIWLNIDELRQTYLTQIAVGYHPINYLKIINRTFQEPIIRRRFRAKRKSYGSKSYLRIRQKGKYVQIRRGTYQLNSFYYFCYFCCTTFGHRATKHRVTKHRANRNSDKKVWIINWSAIYISDIVCSSKSVDTAYRYTEYRFNPP